MKVLSTTTRMPRRWAASTTRRTSTSFRVGFDGLSIQTSRVSSSISELRSRSISVVKETRMPWVLATLGKWVVLVTMTVPPMLVVQVAVSSTVLSPVEWGQVAHVVMQVSPWWWQEALVAVAIARSA